MLKIEGVRDLRTLPVPPGLETLVRAASPFLIYEPEQPLALLEYGDIDL
jgi:hypothetical protein